MQKSPVTSSVALSSLENETVMPNREKSTYKIKGKLPATLWVKVQKNNTHVLLEKHRQDNPVELKRARILLQ